MQQKAMGKWYGWRQESSNTLPSRLSKSLMTYINPMLWAIKIQIKSHKK